MASVRVINYISHRRVAAASTLKHVCVLSNSYTRSDFRQDALYCTKKAMTKGNPAEYDNKVQVGFAEVVKENTKSFGYLGVIIGGIGVTGFMFYMIFDELFSSKSPNTIYSKALDRCIKDPKVIDLLGQPIKAYGEESRRGRRSHISHVSFYKDGVRHMRMKFYVQGIRRRGTVNLEVEEDKSGKYVYRYLYVLVDDIMQTIVKLEDNRDQNKNYIAQGDLEFS